MQGPLSTRGCFVTGTDTGVGKSILAACTIAALRAEGVPVAAFKPVLTGLEEPAPEGWGRDDELLARAAGASPSEVSLFTYGPPVSPHLAAELAGRELDPGRILEAVSTATGEGRFAVVEGVGGLLVPLADGYDVRRLAAELGLPLLVAARPGLGTINHTLLTLEAARAAALTVAGVVLTPWPDAPSVLERSNRETIARLGDVPVATLPTVAPDRLAQAGGLLPLRDWLLASEP